LSSSPWMRGAPQSGLARLIRRIRSRISVLIRGVPDGAIATARRAGSLCDATGPRLLV
jgi:hypothetical protein